MQQALSKCNHLPPLTRVPHILKDLADDFTNRLLSHPFLVRCGDGTITRKELDKFLIQQGKYSQYFTRYLCALMSKLDADADVLRLAENLSEELGYGDDARIPHSSIYAKMVADFDLNSAASVALPETQALIESMFMLCYQPGGTAGLAAMCLGAEAVVPSLYARIVQGFLANDVSIERLNFFTIHIECDDDHAQTMFDMLSAKIALSNANYVTAVQSGEIIINARLRMFDALLREQ